MEIIVLSVILIIVLSLILVLVTSKKRHEKTLETLEDLKKLLDTQNLTIDFLAKKREMWKKRYVLLLEAESLYRNIHSKDYNIVGVKDAATKLYMGLQKEPLNEDVVIKLKNLNRFEEIARDSHAENDTARIRSYCKDILENKINDFYGNQDG